MQPQIEKYLISLDKARKSLQLADHLTYMTFPIVRENKLLLKVLDELYLSIISAINSILQYEYLYKRIQIYKDAKENFRTFLRLSKKYNLDEKQISIITEILSLAEKHKKSPFEFSKNDKIVIMSDNLRTDTLTLEKIKSYLTEAKDILKKIGLIVKI